MRLKSARTAPLCAGRGDVQLFMLKLRVRRHHAKARPCFGRPVRCMHAALMRVRYAHPAHHRSSLRKPARPRSVRGDVPRPLVRMRMRWPALSALLCAHRRSYTPHPLCAYAPAGIALRRYRASAGCLDCILRALMSEPYTCARRCSPS